MRTFFPAILSMLLCFTSPLSAKTINKGDPVESLQKEVVQLFKKNPIKFEGDDQHEVTVGFMINAKNEIIVLDTNGESEQACAFVKRVLSYQKIKYAYSKQLTRYSIKIHLVNEERMR